MACQRTHPDGLGTIPAEYYLPLPEDLKAQVELDVKLADAESRSRVLQDLRDCQAWVEALKRRQDGER